MAAAAAARGRVGVAGKATPQAPHVEGHRGLPRKEGVGRHQSALQPSPLLLLLLLLPRL